MISVRSRDGVHAEWSPVLLLNFNSDAVDRRSEEQAAAWFRAAYARPERPYWVMQDARPRALLHTIALRVTEGCSGPVASGTGILTPEVPPGWTGLAVTDTGPSHRWHRRPLNGEEERIFLAVGRSLLGLQDGETGPQWEVRLGNAFAYTLTEPDSTIAIAALSASARTSPSAPSYASILVIASTGAEGLVPTHTWVHRWQEEDREEMEPVDLLDLDGDGHLEWIVGHGWYESSRYEAIGLGGDLRYQGAITGC